LQYYRLNKPVSWPMVNHSKINKVYLITKINSELTIVKGNAFIGEMATWSRSSKIKIYFCVAPVAKSVDFSVPESHSGVHFFVCSGGLLISKKMNQKHVGEKIG